MPGHTPDYTEEGFHVSVTFALTGCPHQRHGSWNSPGVRWNMKNIWMFPGLECPTKVESWKKYNLKVHFGSMAAFFYSLCFPFSSFTVSAISRRQLNPGPPFGFYLLNIVFSCCWPLTACIDCMFCDSVQHLNTDCHICHINSISFNCFIPFNFHFTLSDTFIVQGRYCYEHSHWLFNQFLEWNWSSQILTAGTAYEEV